MNILAISILVPLVSGLLVLLGPRYGRIKQALVIASAFVNLVIAFMIFEKDRSFTLSWLPTLAGFSLRVYSFSGFILMSAACFTFLAFLYSLAFMRGKAIQRKYYGYLLLAVAFINGVSLADNLLVLLFFWEGMLVLLYGLISIKGKGSYPTAIKAFVIQAVADLCMMAGIALTAHLAGTFTISSVKLPAEGALPGLAFILLSIGAIAKAGGMPFHSWIPDAAEDAPLGFMALVVVCLDKLIGIYFLVRIAVDMFKLGPGTPLSYMLMVVGSVTIIAAVMMALVQKNYKRLLAYHAISQSGYMILGIGTCNPIGIVGGIFHMLNNANYKSGLFLTAGSVEKEAGTNDLDKLGGLGKKMPVTFICFAVMALSISGVPPFSGFFSKELIYDAALHGGWIFYMAALAGTFLTAASFLKLGHAVYLGKPRTNTGPVKEAPKVMLLPMCVIAALCLISGVFFKFILNRWIMPVVAADPRAHIPGPNIALILASIFALSLAFIHHIAMVGSTNDALKAADDIHYAPVLKNLYSLAGKKYFDPYDIGLLFTRVCSRAAMFIDRGINWVYDVAMPGISNAISGQISAMHSGYYVTYIVWALVGAGAVALFLLK